MKIDPVKMSGMIGSNTVTAGIIAFRATCHNITRCSASPLERAVRTCSACIASSSETRTYLATRRKERRHRR